MLLGTNDFDPYMINNHNRSFQLWFANNHKIKILKQAYRNKGYSYLNITEENEKEYWNERYLICDAEYSLLYSKSTKLYFNKKNNFLPITEIEYKNLKHKDKKNWRPNIKKTKEFLNNRLIEINYL